MAKTFQDTITVTFKPKGDKDLVRAINKLGRATKNLIKPQVKLENEFRRFNTTTKKTGKNVGMLDTRNKRLAQTNGLLANSFATIRSKMLLWSFAMSLGVRQIVSMVKESSKVEAMEMGFNTLAGATEVSAVALEKLKSATNDTMSEFDLFQQANNAMILGVTKNSDEMAEMFDIAQRLGRALGRDTASSVESLITGIGRQSRLMLDNIGIIVKAEEAYEAYADSLETTADELTDAQKKQAFLTATMESARQKVKTLGEENLTARDKFDALGASSSNLANAIGGILSQSFALLSENTSSVLDDITELINLKTDNRGLETIFWDTFEEGEEAVKNYARTYGTQIIGLNKPLIRQLEQLKTSSETVEKELGKTYGGKLRKGYRDVSKDVRLFSKLIERLTEDTRAYNVERDKKINLGQTRKNLEIMVAQEAEYRRLNPVIATNEKLEKDAKKALESTVIARIASTEALIEQLTKDKEASTQKAKHTEAIKTLNKELDLLKNPIIKLTQSEQSLADALKATDEFRRKSLIALQNQLLAIVKTNKKTKEHEQALADVGLQLEKLNESKDKVVDTYEEWLAVQEKQAKSDEDIAGWTQILIDKDYALADALGLVKKTQAELNAEKAIAGTDLSKEKEIRDTLTILELEQSSIDTLIAQGDAVKSNIAQLEKRKALLQVQMLVPDADKTAVTAKAQEIEATLELLRAERREFAWQEKHMEQLKSKVRLWEAEKEAITTGIGFGDEAGKEIEILGLGDESRLGEITKLITEYKNSIAELGLTKEQATKKLLLPESIREVSKELAEHTEFVQAGKAEYESIGLQIEKYTESLLKLGLTEEQIARNAVLIEAIKLQKEALEELGETQKAVWSEGIEIALSQFREASGAYSSFVQGAVDADINALKARDSYDKASLAERATMEEKIRRKHTASLKRSAILEKASAVASATMNTYEAITDTLAKVPPPFKIPASMLIGALGFAQVASIIGTPLAYRQGGLIGGRSHEQGGTMIEAERGEFIMSRSAVESIGTSALNNMNQGGGGAITINISAPLVDETVIDHIIPAINKAQRMNLA